MSREVGARRAVPLRAILTLRTLLSLWIHGLPIFGVEVNGICWT